MEVIKIVSFQILLKVIMRTVILESLRNRGGGKKPLSNKKLNSGGLSLSLGFPGSTVVKNLPMQETWDTGSIPGLGRSPGVENGNPLKYSCLGNPMDRGAGRLACMGLPSGTRLRDWAHTQSLIIHIDLYSSYVFTFIKNGDRGVQSNPIIGLHLQKEFREV